MTFAPTPLPVAPLAPPPSFDIGATRSGTPAPSQGGENYVVTRPGTLLFPPLQAPSSSLTAGFSQEVVQEQRKQAFENAFADGPEPRSQLLLPLANAESAAPAEESEWVFETVIIESRPNPQPAPRKPEPTAAMLAALQDAEQQEPGLQEALDQDLTPVTVTPVETVELTAGDQLAPEFMEQAAENKDQPVSEAPVVEPASPSKPLTASEVDQSGETTVPVQSPAPDQTASAEVVPAASAPEPAQNQVNTAIPTDSAAPLNLLPENNPAPEAATEMRARSAETNASEAPERAVMVAELAEIDDADSAPAPLQPMQQTASLPEPEDLQDISFTFAADSAELTTSAQAVLQSLANDLRDKGDDRIQVLGYASSAIGSTDLDRQLALSRALKVRTFLIDAGIPSQRIQVRPPRSASGSGPANRVDISPIGS